MENQPLNPSASAPVMPQMPMPRPSSNKGLLWIASVVAVLAAYAATAYFTNLWPFRDMTPADSTEGWQTYTNAECGFQIQHPVDVTVVTTGLDGSSPTEGCSISLRQYCSATEYNYILGLALWTPDAFASYYDTPIGSSELTRNSDYVVTTYRDFGGGLQNCPNLPYLDVPQILSTFRFMKTTYSAQDSALVSLDNTWDIYTNFKYGFSIKVPKNILNGTISITEESGSVVLGVSGEDDIVWHINTAPISQQEQLSAYVRTQPYWSECHIEGIVPANNSPYLEVILQRTEPEGGCFTNYRYVIFYSPEHQRVASWLLGQAPSFFTPTEFAGSYDGAMVESFRFTR